MKTQVRTCTVRVTHKTAAPSSTSAYHFDAIDATEASE